MANKIKNIKYDNTSYTISPDLKDSINELSNGDSTITDNTEFITSNVAGTGTDKNWYKRKGSQIWNWIKSMCDTFYMKKSNKVYYDVVNNYLNSANKSNEIVIKTNIPITTTSGGSTYLLPTIHIVGEIPYKKKHLDLLITTMTYAKHLYTYNFCVNRGDLLISKLYLSEYTSNVGNVCLAISISFSTSLTLFNSSFYCEYFNSSKNLSDTTTQWSIEGNKVTADNPSIIPQDGMKEVNVVNMVCNFNNIENANSIGYDTIASTAYQTVLGKFNKETTSLLAIGNGTSASARSNCFEVASDGTVYLYKGNKKYKMNMDALINAGLVTEVN